MIKTLEPFSKNDSLLTYFFLDKFLKPASSFNKPRSYACNTTSEGLSIFIEQSFITMIRTCQNTF